MRSRIDATRHSGNDRDAALGQFARQHQRGVLAVRRTTTRSDDRDAWSLEAFCPGAAHVQDDRWIVRLSQKRWIDTIVQHNDVAAELADAVNLTFSAFE